MAAVKKEWTDLTRQVADVTRLLTLYNPILHEAQKTLMKGSVDEEYEKKVDTMGVRLGAVNANVRKFFDEYVKNNAPASEEDYEIIEKIITGIKNGFKGECSFRGPKDGVVYEFVDTIKHDGSLLTVSLRNLASDAVNVCNSVAKNRLEQLQAYNDSLAIIRRTLYGIGPDRGYLGEVEKYERYWKNFPTTEQEKLLNSMRDLATQLEADYKELSKEFEDVAKNPEKTLSDEFTSKVNSILDDDYGSLKKLEGLLYDASVVEAEESTSKSVTNKHPGIVKKAIAAGLVVAAVAGILALWGKFTDWKFIPEPTPEQDLPDSNQSQTIDTVADYQQEVAEKIAELEKASANWSQKYKDMLKPYLGESPTDETYQALLALDQISSSKEDLKLAEDYADEIMTKLISIQALAEAEQEKPEQVIPKDPIVFEGADLSEISNLNDFRNPFVSGTPTKVEVDFIQEGNSKGDAVVRIYFTNKDGTVVAYAKGIGIDRATDYLEEGKLPAKAVSNMLAKADKTTSNVSTYGNYIEKYPELTTADGVAVKELYIDQDDLSKLAAGGTVDINWAIVDATGRVYKGLSELTSTKPMLLSEAEGAAVADILLQLRLGNLKPQSVAGYDITLENPQM